MTDQERLAAIRERMEAATPGPWYVVDEGSGSIATEAVEDKVYARIGRHINQEIVRGDMHAFGVLDPADADFIAHAREDVPALWHLNEALVGALADYERMRAENAALRAIVDALAHEDRYQAETGEGSIAYLARLIAKARAVLAALPMPPA